MDAETLRRLHRSSEVGLDVQAAFSPSRCFLGHEFFVCAAACAGNIDGAAEIMRAAFLRPYGEAKTNPVEEKSTLLAGRERPGAILVNHGDKSPIPTEAPCGTNRSSPNLGSPWLSLPATSSCRRKISPSLENPRPRSLSNSPTLGWYAVGQGGDFPCMEIFGAGMGRPWSSTIRKFSWSWSASATMVAFRPCTIRT
jgi:hypothetical protein